jgi:hypothetical protein
MAESSDPKHRYREFLDLMPLTLALAGLPDCESGKYFSSDQIESRLFTIRLAYKAARQIARESIKS